MSNGQSSNGSWRVVIAKQLELIPKSYIRRIRQVIEEIATNPFGGGIRRLEGSETLWRRRVGNYRILFETLPSQRAIFIYEIARRTSSTY
jgi:mRNA interferase RelE/StbE